MFQPSITDYAFITVHMKVACLDYVTFLVLLVQGSSLCPLYISVRR